MALLPLGGVVGGVLSGGHVFAATTIAGETFSSTSTVANQWISGGGSNPACLTAANTSAANSIPACTDGAIDSSGSGALRLTPASNDQSGFAIYDTPVSTSEGLDVEFDMYQYGGTGADGISFFLINGAASPTQPGALGGSLGYSSTSSPVRAGIVGGYVGIGFDRFGNFSSTGFGAGGVGRFSNSITVRGSEATNYQYVTKKSAAGQIGVESTQVRANAKRHVRVSVSTNNIMTVAVNYFNGNGLVTELSGINLNTINGAGSLPASFKFGFAASTGGSNNIHEISGLTVDSLKSNVSVTPTHSTGFKQGETGQVTLATSNDSGAQATTGTITVTDTLPAGLVPTAASGNGWACTVAGQLVTCSRPGDGANALAPGASAPNITVQVAISTTAAASLSNPATVTTADNINANPTSTDTIAVAASGDADGISDSTEAAAPNNGDANNDGTADKLQAGVTSLPNPVTSNYAVLESTGCTGNTGVSVGAADANSPDGNYSYPVGLINFSIHCTNPGDTATITQYFYGDYDAAKFVMRKYDATAGTYQTIPGAVLSTVTIGGKTALKAVYQVTDGGSLDADRTANGTIVDPAGPALLPVVAGSTTASLANTGINLEYISVGALCLVLLAIVVRSKSNITKFSRL